MKTLGEQVLLSREESQAAFEELKRKGIIYTQAPAVHDVGKKNYPVRCIGCAPAADLPNNVITLGPFPMEKNAFEAARDSIYQSAQQPDIDNTDERLAFCTFLAFVKLQYEKLGTSSPDYGIKAADEDLAEVISLLTLFEVDEPAVCDAYVWIFPKTELKNLMLREIKRSRKREDYSWWNHAVRLGDSIEPDTMNDHPDHFSLVPTRLFGSWSRYLPIGVEHIIMCLYGRCTIGGEFTAFDSLSEVRSIITRALTDNAANPQLASPDRELLIKELYDFNSLPYPVEEDSVVSLLEHIGMLQWIDCKGKMLPIMSQDLPNAERVLRFPLGWEERAEAYITTGSVLFSYLSIDEALGDNGKGY